MKFILIILFPILAHAEYFVGYGTGAYMGRHQLQGEWVPEKNSPHHLLGFLGYTQDQEIGDIKQIGAAYLWSLKPYNFENYKWTPLLVGGFFTYTDHKKYYLEAPKKYNDPDYYDTTSLRLGLRFSSEIILVRKSEKTIRLSLDGSLLERALIAYFNNSSELGIFPAFWSLGVSVKFDL